MRKVAFALVVLLHVCYGVRDLNLNKEIIEKLEKLQTLKMGKQLNTTFPDSLLKASNKQSQVSCVGEFVRQLELLLNNTIVPETNRTLILDLHANLSTLKSQPPRIHGTCKMEILRKPLRPFKPYIVFLKHINSRKK